MQHASYIYIEFLSATLCHMKRYSRKWKRKIKLCFGQMCFDNRKELFHWEKIFWCNKFCRVWEISNLIYMLRPVPYIFSLYNLKVYNCYLKYCIFFQKYPIKCCTNNCFTSLCSSKSRIIIFRSRIHLGFPSQYPMTDLDSRLNILSPSQSQQQ